MRTGLISGLAVVSAVMSIPALAQAQAAAADKTYTLQAKYTVGDLLNYKMQMTMNMEMKTEKGDSPIPAMQTTASASMRYKTVGIKPDGTAVVVIKTTGGKMNVLGNDSAMPEVPDVTMEVDKLGMAKVRGLENAPGMQALQQMMSMNRLPAMGAILPNHAVKAGDSWETELPMPFGKAKVVSTLIGPEKIGDADTLKIKQVMTMPMDMKMGADQKPTQDASKAIVVMSGTITMNGLMNVLPDTARLVKSGGEFSADIAMKLQGAAAGQSPTGDNMTMKMGGNMTMALVSAEKVPPAPAAPVKQPAAKKG